MASLLPSPTTVYPGSSPSAPAGPSVPVFSASGTVRPDLYGAMRNVTDAFAQSSTGRPTLQNPWTDEIQKPWWFDQLSPGRRNEYLNAAYNAATSNFPPSVAGAFPLGPANMLSMYNDRYNRQYGLSPVGEMRLAGRQVTPGPPPGLRTNVGQATPQAAGSPWSSQLAKPWWFNELSPAEQALFQRSAQQYVGTGQGDFNSLSARYDQKYGPTPPAPQASPTPSTPSAAPAMPAWRMAENAVGTYVDPVTGRSSNIFENPDTGVQYYTRGINGMALRFQQNPTPPIAPEWQALNDPWRRGRDAYNEYITNENLRNQLDPFGSMLPRVPQPDLSNYQTGSVSPYRRAMLNYAGVQREPGQSYTLTPEQQRRMQTFRSLPFETQRSFLDRLWRQPPSVRAPVRGSASSRPSGRKRRGL